LTQALIISNPAAARAGGNGSALRAARRRLADGGMATELVATEGPGHAERLARAAVGNGTELLIAHGGDGTVMEVAAALIGTGRPLGLGRAGPAIGVAAPRGGRRPAHHAADVILAGHRRTIDVGRLTTSSGTRCFAVCAGAGFDAELMHRTPSRRKRAFGIGAYVATAVGLATSLTRAAVRIETERVTLEARAATVLIANCREIIPGVLPLGPEIAPDDGILDVVVLDAASLTGAAGVAWQMLLRRPHAHPGITFLRAQQVTITAAADLPVQADGEACGRAPLDISVVPGGLTVFAPAPR
jgi:YegS/Rv2252/BmrU family lipid kinase